MSLFTFIFILCVGLFVVFQNGLYLDNVSISNIHAKNIYIKYNKQLNISIEELKITSKKSDNPQKFTYKKLNKYLKIVSQATHLFESIVITKIQIKNVRGSFEYINNEKGFLVLHSLNLKLRSNIYFRSHLLQLSIKNFEDKKRALKASGTVIFDTSTQQIYSQINLDIHNDANLTLYSIADEKQLHYNILSNKHITNISHLIALAHLPKEVIYWAYTAINMDYLNIQRIKGFITYNDLKNAYKNIKIKAIAKNLRYTYNPKLNAVNTQQTNLEFIKGVLYIRPQDTYSYGMYLDKSWLKIDFSKREELLTLHLLFDGMLNKDMLYVLNTYDIKLPFLQHKGKVATNLTIKVNLRTIDVNANGTFYTKKANFDYLGLNIDIFNTLIKLNNYDITINNMKAKYKDIAQADVHVKFNAKKSSGTVTFDVNKVMLKDVALQTKKKSLHVVYNIRPKKDTIAIAKSQWIYKEHDIALDKLLVDFNLDTLKAKIPIVTFYVDTIAKGYLNGVLDLKNSRLNLDADLLKLKYNGIELSQSSTPFKITYNKIFSITSDKNIFFTVNGSGYKAKNFHINFQKNSVYLKHTMLYIGKYIHTKIYAKYNFDSQQAHISLSDFILINPRTKQTLYANNKIILGAHVNDKNITIDSKELNAKFISDANEWQLHFDSIDNIAKKSPFLQKYKLTEGEISFFKKNNIQNTQFLANITYPYHLLTQQNKEIEKYTIAGEITKKQVVHLNINHKVKAKIDDNIEISAHDTGLNLYAIIDFTKILKQAKTTKKKINLSVSASNSYLYLKKGRYALADKINMQYFNNILSAQLLYKKGNAGFKLENNKFHLYGKNFNDTFMEKFFVLSKFSGGNLDFTVDGTLDNYKGVFYVNNTTMIDYRLLNNILAFINTIPSLVTFSLPGYSKKGLHVNNAYAKFNVKKELVTIPGIYLDSKEVKILGKGKANIKNDTIDLTLNLKTDLGRKLSKIPIAGYIIFDGKSISTTLKVNGKLSNPKISTTLAKDIIVAPLNIIKRTLTLPYELIKKLY